MAFLLDIGIGADSLLMFLHPPAPRFIALRPIPPPPTHTQGDFIFYSVLVSKAALYSFTTFAACMLVILSGLGGTLVLLAVWKQALPALPISIFLGVVFYLLTRLVIEPWIHDMLRTPLYV